MKIKIKDCILGASLTVLGSILFLFVIPEGVVVPSSVSSLALAPDLWPRVLALMLLGLGVLLFVPSSLRLLGGTAEVTRASSLNFAGASAMARPFGWFVLFVAAIALFVYWAAIHILGIPVASAIALASFALLYGERRYGVILTLSTVVPVSLYLFFSKIAQVPIPMGVFE